MSEGNRFASAAVIASSEVTINNGRSEKRDTLPQAPNDQKQQRCSHQYIVDRDGDVSIRDQLWRVTEEENLHEQMRELHDMILTGMEELMISHQDDDQIRKFPVARDIITDGHQSRSC